MSVKSEALIARFGVESLQWEVKIVLKFALALNLTVDDPRATSLITKVVEEVMLVSFCPMINDHKNGTLIYKQRLISGSVNPLMGVDF